MRNRDAATDQGNFAEAFPFRNSTLPHPVHHNEQAPLCNKEHTITNGPGFNNSISCCKIRGLGDRYKLIANFTSSWRAFAPTDICQQR